MTGNTAEERGVLGTRRQVRAGRSEARGAAAPRCLQAPHQ